MCQHELAKTKQKYIGIKKCLLAGGRYFFLKSLSSRYIYLSRVRKTLALL